MTNNGIVNIHGKQYVTVAKRVSDAHKDGKLEGVKTEVLQFDPVIVIKAIVSIEGKEYTGISSINTETAQGVTEKTNPYEVTETSAVGRALAFAGFEVEQGIASADEVAKANVEEPSRYDNREEKPSSKSAEYSAQKEHYCTLHGKDLKERHEPDGIVWDHRALINGVWNTCYGSGWKTQQRVMSEAVQEEPPAY